MFNFFKRLFGGKAKNDSVKADSKQYNNNSSAPDLGKTQTVVWMAHRIDLPYLPQEKHDKLNTGMMLMLCAFEHAVEEGKQEKTIEIYNEFQKLMKVKLGNGANDEMAQLRMVPFKICALSKDLLDLYKMVIEGHRDADVLSGKGSIRRILKYSIELGSPAKTLDALTDYFVHNAWFDNMPEQSEWLKLALECMMVTGNGDMGNEILRRLQDEGGISDEEKEELMDHAREFRSQIDDSWM